MAGAYCRYCDHRCFVYRVIPAVPDVSSEQGLHMATCRRGMEHDRRETGHDHTTAINPVTQCPVCRGAGGWQQYDGAIEECPRGCMTGGAA